MINFLIKGPWNIFGVRIIYVLLQIHSIEYSRAYELKHLSPVYLYPYNLIEYS